MSAIIRVLIVDDSAFVRKVVREMLSLSPFIEVVGTARNGAEALDQVEALQPDVVTTDLMMPELDGVGFLREQMRRRPIPIVAMSSLGEDGSEVMLALEAGAVDFIQKPTALATDQMFEVRRHLLDSIKMAAGSRPERLRLAAKPELLAASNGQRTDGSKNFDAIVIGISTGGPQALRHMIPQLPATFPVPIAIVMHMPVGYTAMYAEKLNEISHLSVIEAAGGESMQAGTVILAQAGKHMSFKKRVDGTVVTRLGMTPHDTPHRPSVDVMFESASSAYKERTLGVIMTGMGHDGRSGAARIKADGGTVFAESEESCIVFGMPGAVVSAGLVDSVIKLENMAAALMEAI